MRRAAVALGAVVLAASACSLGPREEWADAIHDAPEAARQARTAKVWISTAVKAIETNIRVEPEPLVAKAEGVVDFANRSAKVLGRPKRQPTVYFDRLSVYLPRSATSIGTTTQRWARFDFTREPEEDIDDNDRRLAVGAGVISPALAVELLEGALTGSVERVGSETKAGAKTTHYKAKIAPDGAIRDIDDEERREGILRVHETLGIQEDVYTADVWIDDEGRPRGIRYTVRQQKDRVNAFEMTIGYEFFEYGAPADITSPGRDDSITSPRFRAFIEEYTRAAF